MGTGQRIRYHWPRRVEVGECEVVDSVIPFKIKVCGCFEPSCCKWHRDYSSRMYYLIDQRKVVDAVIAFLAGLVIGGFTAIIFYDIWLRYKGVK